MRYQIWDLIKRVIITEGHELMLTNKIGHERVS